MGKLIELFFQWRNDENGNPFYLFVLILLCTSPFVVILLSDIKIEEILLLTLVYEKPDIVSLFSLWAIVEILAVITWYFFNKLPYVSNKKIGIILVFMELATKQGILLSMTLIS